MRLLDRLKARLDRALDSRLSDDQLEQVAGAYESEGRDLPASLVEARARRELVVSDQTVPVMVSATLEAPLFDAALLASHRAHPALRGDQALERWLIGLVERAVAHDERDRPPFKSGGPL